MPAEVVTRGRLVTYNATADAAMAAMSDNVTVGQS